MPINDKELIATIEKNILPVGDTMREYDPIISAASGKKVVLIGEASHGTHEFYRTRAEISQRLIQEEGFDAIIVEADWPDAYAINRYVCGTDPKATPESALAHFERFPTWMWANQDVLDFMSWLRAFNDMSKGRTVKDIRTGKDISKSPVGFYGLDLYSMSTSVHAVICYLDSIDPASAALARVRYSCLDYFRDSPQSYGHAVNFGLATSCENEIIAQLLELQKKSFEYMKLDGFVAEEEYFCAEQNAKLVYNAEQYYRAMFDTKTRPRPNLWNMRDRHMFETLQDLNHHLSNRLGRDAKIIVWAHNSHVGNAAATEMSRRGEINIGQLTREIYGKNSLSIGFSTATGTVTAASDWDAPPERKIIRKPIPASYEDIFRQVSQKKFLLKLSDYNEATDLLCIPRLQRAIGVIYQPETERESHYFYSYLPEQFDFIIHFDETTAVEPIITSAQWHRGEMDETYPSGL